MSKYSNLLKAIGPGILFASTAIGVSHLVQSTRAGAEYGFALLWAVVIANLFKYPFFKDKKYKLFYIDKFIYYWESSPNTKCFF